MKKKWISLFGLVAGAVLSLSVLAACKDTEPQNTLYDSGVVRAFHAVMPQGELVAQTAVSDGREYLVTVITSTSVSEYHVDAEFKVNASKVIAEDAANVSLAAESAEPLSDLERAFEEALRLSGIARTEVEGFDFDKDTYMGKSVFKVEIEDLVAEYSYIFSASDFTLLGSKTELKNTGAPEGESSYIGEERAKEIACKAVGIEESMAKGLTLKSVLESGRKLYKAAFEFDGFRYDIDIDALSGEIVKFSKRISDGSAALPNISAIISEEEAKEIALAFAFPEGTDGVRVTFLKADLDYEHGKFVYEVEFDTEDCEYEFLINASDGTILDVEIEAGRGGMAQGEFITREQAIAKVLEQAGADALVLEVDIEKERFNGESRYYYEIDVKVNGREIEYLVDAVTGEVTRNEGFTGNPADPNPTLLEEDALRIALDSFGLTADQLTYQKIKLEREDGRLCYEIKLHVGNVEYSITIDAQNGDILEQEIDREHAEEMPPQTSTDEFITREQAIEAVKKVAGANARIEDVELEDEGTGANKRFYYEVEVTVNGREYDYYVDAITGEVRLKGELVESGKTLIGEQAAIEIAIRYFSLTESEVRRVEVKLEEDDGILIYEVEFKVKSMEYTVEIDAETGTVLESDISFD